MADELVITGLDSASGTQTWAHGLSGIGGFATGNYEGVAFLGYAVTRMADSWQFIDTAGAEGVDAKWFGRSARVYTIAAVIAAMGGSRTDRYTDLETRVDQVMGLNDALNRFSLAGPINKSPVVFGQVAMDPIGRSTGPLLFFTIPAVLLTG